MPGELAPAAERRAFDGGIKGLVYRTAMAPMNLRDHVAQWLSGAVPAPPIAQTLGITLTSVSDNQATATMQAVPSLHNAMGTLHGGVLADLADVTMGVALANTTAEGESFTTSHLAVTYFVPVREGRLRAHATVVRRGRTSGYAECMIENEVGALLAKASCLCVFQAKP